MWAIRTVEAHLSKTVMLPLKKHVMHNYPLYPEPFSPSLMRPDWHSMFLRWWIDYSVTHLSPAHLSTEDMSCSQRQMRRLVWFASRWMSCTMNCLLNKSPEIWADASQSFVKSFISFPGFDLRTAQVVSLATGTKCVDLDNDSDHSETLGDCHAEVMSRRALVRFLYAQLELLLWYDPQMTLKYVFLLLFSV